MFLHGHGQYSMYEARELPVYLVIDPRAKQASIVCYFRLDKKTNLSYVEWTILLSKRHIQVKNLNRIGAADSLYRSTVKHAICYIAVMANDDFVFLRTKI